MEPLSNLKLKFPAVNTTQSSSEIFKDENIDAVAICTPVETHTDLVSSALEANKHVFIEKPFGRDFQECRSLCKLAEEKAFLFWSVMFSFLMHQFFNKEDHK